MAKTICKTQNSASCLLEGQLEEQLQKSTGNRSGVSTLGSGDAGSVRLFLKARRAFSFTDGGYLNASEGEELVAVFAETEWFYGFALNDRLRKGWFPAEDVVPT